ncbi:MAG: hypothetical protein VCD00_01735 [Candidatus Hydrogenedentota bacterium]
MNKRIGRFGSRDGNCALYGCAGVVVVGLIGVVTIGFVVRQAFNELKEKYTATEAVELPSIEVSDTERDATIERVDTWVAALESDEATTQLILTEHDVNVLIEYHEELENLSGKVYLTLDESTVHGEMSYPLDAIPGFSGRYFNGSATFEVSLANNRLVVYVIEASVGGEAVPDEFISGVRNENLAQEMHNNPETREVIESLESVEVVDGTLIITPKGFEAAEEDAEPAEEEVSEV